MLNNIRFAATVICLLIVPAIIYCMGEYLNGYLTVEYLSHWFVGNYAFMAAPHFLVLFVFLTISSYSLQAKWLTVSSLLILDIVLLTFQSWIWLTVLNRESGLAWMLYVPVWIVSILLIMLFHHYRGKRIIP